MLASQIIFTFAGGGPYIVVTQMGRTSAEYGAWFATTGFAYLVGNLLLRALRAAPSAGKADLVRAGAAARRQPAQPGWSFAGHQPGAGWLFGTQMIVMVANAFVMSNCGGRRHQRPPRSRRHRVGRDGIFAEGVGALVSQFGAYLGGHSTTTLPLTAAIFALSIACAAAMFFLVPRREVVVSEELIEKVEKEDSRMM